MAEPELRGTATELSQYLTGVPKTVVIAGEAEVRAPADQAVVTLKVTTEHRSLQEALRINLEVRNKLIAFFKGHGIPQERVHGSRFSSTPKFGIWSEKAKSYRVENLLKVTVEDEHEFQIAASSVDGNPEVQFTGADFEHKDKEALKAKAVAQACDNANSRRKIFEEKLGLTLKPERFSGGAVNENIPVQLRNYSSEYLSSGVSLRKAAASTPLPQATGAAVTEENVSSFGELVYTVQLQIEYSVQAK